MSGKKLSFTEAKTLSIIDYLASAGFQPVKIIRADHWYYSPFREERTPSFKVNAKLNLWYDHGTGEGGTLIDLGAKLKQCSLAEFVERLSQDVHSFSFHRQPPLIIPQENKLEILAVQELNSDDLLQYLSGRRIMPDTAKKFCKEIAFRIRDKAYKAVGFQNRSGAWELRNHWFKGSSAPKDISIITDGSKKLGVLEGFMDFLSLIQSDNQELNALRDNSDFLILNSLRLLSRAIPLLQNRDVNLLLDNDNAASEAKKALIDKGVAFKDASGLYLSHKDLNDFIVSDYKNKMTQSLSKTKPVKLRR
ncbi:toprim domain-containing protein [Pseudochryseolinea flava]|uniref:DNA primase n=1 Tax=Pseudochryseolinea flava TaxID=2059302 RepID=A0A364XYX5_9BACT|nr:toprim domain-containing protein [Pseudochryseolinea flava]RAV99661.1 DNA primase [Pseudochryseolinea flava]